MRSSPSSPPALRGAIDHAGYYPALVTEAVEEALAAEPVSAHLVYHEATFDRDELRRHVTVLVLTPSRLIVSHTDDHPADDAHPTPFATTSTVTWRRSSSRSNVASW